MGLPAVCALIELIAMPITGMIYMMLMFPIRYSPLKSLIMQFPSLIIQLPAIFWISSPNYMQVRFLLGGMAVILLAYSFYRVFAVPLRTSCAWYFAYCMVSPHTLVGTCYSIFSPYGDIMPTEVHDTDAFGRFLFKIAIIFAVTAVMIYGIKRLYDWLPLSRRNLQRIEFGCNAFYLFFTAVWEIIFFFQNTLTLRNILPFVMFLGIVSVVIMKLLFDAAEKQQLVQEHEFLAQQCDLQYRSFQDSLSHEQAIRKFRHDTVGHLQTMHAFLEQRKYDRIEQYAAQLAAQYRSRVQPQAGDCALVNIVVKQYMQICQSRGIQLDYRGECRLHSADADLMCLIADLLEYHIARCRDTMDASQPLITLELRSQMDSLIISCKDTVSCTSRASKEAFRMSAEQTRQCGGSLQQEQNVTVITVPNGS